MNADTYTSLGSGGTEVGKVRTKIATTEFLRYCLARLCFNVWMTLTSQPMLIRHERILIVVRYYE